MTATVELPGFTQSAFTDGPFTHTVYRIGAGRAVLLMHELPGMTRACIGLAKEIAEAGFTVFMPLLFGEPYDDKGFGFFPQLCISREFKLFANGGGSPVVTWLKALARHALAECGGPGVGAIGMCLTGNFAIALMADEAVLAPVVSQPALPLTGAIPLIRTLVPGASAALGITIEQEQDAQKRAAQGVSLMCLRFSNDSISPVERFEALRRGFGAAFIPFLLGSPDGIDSGPQNPYGLQADAHSVLTGEYKDDLPLHPSRLARNAVLSFLQTRLHPAG